MNDESHLRDVCEEIGSRISRIREMRGMTLEQLADELNVSRATVSNWELGRTTSLTLASLSKLSDVLQIDMRYLLSGILHDKGAFGPSSVSSSIADSIRALCGDPDERHLSSIHIYSPDEVSRHFVEAENDYLIFAQLSDADPSTAVVLRVSPDLRFRRDVLSVFLVGGCDIFVGYYRMSDKGKACITNASGVKVYDHTQINTLPIEAVGVVKNNGGQR